MRRVLVVAGAALAWDALFALAIAAGAAAPAAAPADSAIAPARPDATLTEPPPEAGEGEWNVERADSIEAGWVETTFTAGGRAGSAPRTGERVRFRGDAAEGAFRAGDDPLRGGRLRAPVASGVLRAGGLGPRWACGLVLGAAAQPWSTEPDDRGDGAGLRGRAGEGALYRSRGGALELLAARFSRRTLAGARVGAGPAWAGVLAARDAAQFSVALVRDDALAEWAGDARGRWRGEFSVRRTRADTRVVLRLRDGHAAYRSLAEPRRAGPARVVAAQATRASGPLDVRANGAWWAYAPGIAGAAGALEVSRSLVHHAAVVLGCDEQHGTRRDPAFGGVSTLAVGMRQGWWCAWRGRVRGRALELRHELRGRRAFARRAVRRALTARGEASLPFGAGIAWSQQAWSTGAGETLYLSETDGDRLTLRPATGLGTRTRVELAAPLFGGRARGSVQWTESPVRRNRPAWTMEWTRRMRQ